MHLFPVLKGMWASKQKRHLPAFEWNWVCGHKVYLRQISWDKCWPGLSAQTWNHTEVVALPPAPAGLCWLVWSLGMGTPWLPALVHTPARTGCSAQRLSVYIWFWVEFRAAHGKTLTKPLVLTDHGFGLYVSCDLLFQAVRTGASVQVPTSD